MVFATPKTKRTRTSRIAVLTAASLIASSVASAACGTLDALDDVVEKRAGPQGWNCSGILTLSGADGAVCYQAFDFRDAAANELAQVIWGEIKECRDGSAMPQDAQVNHPDSYDLRAWTSGDRIYSVSVKDKGALRKTFVFLRRMPNTN